MAKIGGNKAKCQAYRLSGTRERNKKRKMIRHMKKHPNDKQTGALV